MTTIIQVNQTQRNNMNTIEPYDSINWQFLENNQNEIYYSRSEEILIISNLRGEAV
jgi:hypothetical protein